MKGRMVINGEVHSPVYISHEEDCVTVYRTAGDDIEVMYTLIRARLLPGDHNELELEGFLRRAGDPEHPTPMPGEEYLFVRVSFFPEAMPFAGVYHHN